MTFHVMFCSLVVHYWFLLLIYHLVDTSLLLPVFLYSPSLLVDLWYHLFRYHANRNICEKGCLNNHDFIIMFVIIA